MDRMPLKENTIVRFEDGSTYRIAGQPIGYGGCSLIYPAVHITSGTVAAMSLT